MRSKDCRHYSRRELIEIIYELEQREARLERKLEKAKEEMKAGDVLVKPQGKKRDTAMVM